MSIENQTENQTEMRHRALARTRIREKSWEQHITGDDGGAGGRGRRRRSERRSRQEQGLPILSTQFSKLTSTFLHTALLVGEHRDESIAIRRRELRRCGYSISPPSAALTIARMPARITSGNVGQAATIRARSGSAGADSSESEETVSESISLTAESRLGIQNN